MWKKKQSFAEIKKKSRSLDNIIKDKKLMLCNQTGGSTTQLASSWFLSVQQGIQGFVFEIKPQL
jgi:hypothetical protein